MSMKEMAVDYPGCRFLGIDSTPLRPTVALPENCRFELASILDDIAHPDGAFDYVHHRSLVTEIPRERWHSYIKECVRLCAPGGWVEMMESSYRIYEGGPISQKLNRCMEQVFSAWDLDVGIVDSLNEHMHEAGLVKLTVEDVRLPLGDWSGPAGELALKSQLMLFAELAPFFTSVCGMTPSEVGQMIAEAGEEFKRSYAHTRFRIFVGRKPKSA
ncbi:hypothetical protein THASP1DRAFT_32840 [Thamnocephalis sphaerospora]|uniref:Uncharacterized protein n=1 Tax=Thamnocephalis sphaerospora TaxID=78915 RepID=A0A4P9XIY2_9FUNG|nr:hypothetical protein THASP1DRAFT_32840 [Thamnocephalis sphaerospora]|eukprot:RKP05321.1 hypothetical protein THASP1DRAFT_32840 [Thamnocephalis sphaerospora]